MHNTRYVHGREEKCKQCSTWKKQIGKALRKPRRRLKDNIKNLY